VAQHEVSVTVKGGDKMTPYLNKLAAKLGTGGVVRVGFLAGRNYPANAKGKSLSVAQVAFWNEFGTRRAPARPFFRNTLYDLAPTLGKRMGKIAKATNYDSAKTLALLGTGIKDQLVKAIVDWPADNAKSTEKRKGFNKGLIDTGVMQRSVDFEVKL
jgi:hypothetical protein